jgi:hypothetical protein
MPRHVELANSDGEKNREAFGRSVGQCLDDGNLLGDRSRMSPKHEYVKREQFIDLFFSPSLLLMAGLGLLCCCFIA